MRIINALMNDNMKSAEPKPQAEPDEVEIYMEKSAVMPINSAKSIFQKQLDDGSLNNAQSIFDRHAVFHTESSGDKA